MITASKSQQEFLQSTANITVLRGTLRVGKTYAVLLKALTCPHEMCTVVFPNYSRLMSGKKSMRDILGELPYTLTNTDNVFTLPSGSKIRLVVGQRERLLSCERSWLLLDDADLLPSYELLLKQQPRQQQIALTCTTLGTIMYKVDPEDDSNYLIDPENSSTLVSLLDEVHGLHRSTSRFSVLIEAYMLRKDVTIIHESMI